jgi:hypothetical protein
MAGVPGWGCRATTLKRLFIPSRLKIRLVHAAFFLTLTVFLFSSKTIFKRFSRPRSGASFLLSLKESNEPELYTTDFSPATGSCELPTLDPWSPSIASFIDPSYDPNKDCKKRADFEMVTKLEHGILTFTTSINSQVHTCSYRCLLPDTDWTLIYGEWLSFNNSAIPSCDVVEVACSKVSTFCSFFGLFLGLVFGFGRVKRALLSNYWCYSVLVIWAQRSPICLRLQAGRFIFKKT